MSEQQLLEIASYDTSEAFSEREKLALDLAMALTETPADISQDLYARLREHFDERQLVELAAVASFENYLARFNRVFDIQPSGFSEGAFCPLPDHRVGTLAPPPAQGILEDG